MRIINKKYLLIILLVGVVLTGVIILKPTKEVKLDNVILKQEVNNKTFAMYTETDNGYEEYEGNKFPDMYVLNLTESKCIDNNGNKLEDVLSYENDKVTITSGNTTYCYLYFDKSLGLEIKEKNPNKLSEEIKGAMYRFQGQQKDDVRNYICFGTNDQNTCKGDTDHYMYRIIGIEAETGRVKVIKKEALKETENGLYQWYTDYDTDITFPESNIYKAISGSDFLENPDFVPKGWEEKIATNTWTYGDMLENDNAGAKQIGKELYLVETGQKGTVWDVKANQGDLGAQPYVVQYGQYEDQTFYYIRHKNEKWAKTFNGKVSLMYLHDYYYALSDDAICNPFATDGTNCKNSWMHLSKNDTEAHEWTMTSNGWNTSWGVYAFFYIRSEGYTNTWVSSTKYCIRPVFYIDSSEQLLSGSGTITDPFLIKE